jgi:hypothetical protein
LDARNPVITPRPPDQLRFNFHFESLTEAALPQDEAAAFVEAIAHGLD